MARFIGKPPHDRWEREVLRWIMQGTPDWTILGNVGWTLRRPDGFVREGEADFVVLVPGSGLVVVEVKGSKGFRVEEDGGWHRLDQDGRWIKLDRSPAEQASEGMHLIVSQMGPLFPGKRFPGRFAYLVVYPNGEASGLPTMYDETTIATRRHRNQLPSKIRRALDARGPEALGRAFGEPEVSRVVAHLKDTKFEVSAVDTGEDASEDAKAIDVLTRQQATTLRGLFHSSRVAILGPAGSGKTLLALWRLRTSIELGQSAVYVCYNRALSDFLRLKNPELASAIWNVDRLFQQLVPAWRDHLMGDLGAFFREVLPGLADEVIARCPKLDAVIVDEGQDFSESQLIALFSYARDEGSWCFFADWRQDLFEVGTNTPLGVEVVFPLFHNCRNTVRINEATNRLLEQGIEPMPGLPVGVPPLIEAPSLIAKRAWELASQWRGDGAVAILGPYRLENSSMGAQASGHGMKLSSDIADLGKEGVVLYSTIKAFKGIEAACVIVIDLPIPDTGVSLRSEDLYVACTRATVRLALLAKDAEARGFYEKAVGAGERG